MVGILSYGAYVPIWRIDRSIIAEAAGAGSMGGERALAGWDEDSLTMAVEAGLDCLAGFDPREVDGLYFATVTSPFKQKQSSAFIASALDLRKDAYAFDFNSSTRAGTAAIKAACDAVGAGSARKVLVVAADNRKARPGSDFEQVFGDGAAALLIGRDQVMAEIQGFATVSNPIPGPWQREEDEYLKLFEPKLDRLAGVLTDMPAAAGRLLAEHNLSPADISKFALAGPDPRSYRDLAKALKLDPKTQMDDPLFSTVGITGTPHSLLLLVAALEKAAPGNRIVCVSYGEGSDAFLVRAADQIESAKGRHRGTGYIASKKQIDSYGRFAQAQGTRNTGWPPKDLRASVVKYWRQEKWALTFYGMRCHKCGTLQYPIVRCCINCGAKDDHEEVKIAPRGKVFTFAHDYLVAPGLVPGDGINPATRVIADMDDGCRLWLEMSDYELEEIEIGMPVELTFRLCHDKSGYRFYSWRARPPRG